MTTHALPISATNATSRVRTPWSIWTGRLIGGLVSAFLFVDAAFKLATAPQVIQTTEQLGWSGDTAVTLGGILLIIAVLYAIPRTAVLGAILLTGYLGGAIATHLRIDNPLFTHTLFGAYVGVLAWLSLWLRDPRVRKLFSALG